MIYDWIIINMGDSKHERRKIDMLYSLKKLSFYTPLHNGHFLLSPRWPLWKGSTVHSNWFSYWSDSAKSIALISMPNSKQAVYITGTDGKKLCSAVSKSCSQIKRIDSTATDGIYRVTPSSSTFQVSVLHIYLMKLQQGRFILLVYGLPVISSFHPVMIVD